MNRLETLMAQYPNIIFNFEKLPMRLSGLALGDEVTLNEKKTANQLCQWIMEEIGHIETSVGDITNYESLENMKQEKQARAWGFTRLLTRTDMDHLRREYACEDSDYPAADDIGVELPYLHEVGLAYGLHYKHVLD
ncbi:hypothetical protein CT113_12230 [Levilactobacillus brevis]|uniref:hypothetical protein n=1 Tax=Levilactobacillus brevis TaxID=1580 RepID=UPI000C1B2F00|nr:hypothetical protein [Levilactobacillus brevis]ATU71053.1 hypothetical protein CT113_12230 [Levilactobacillus brevis]